MSCVYKKQNFEEKNALILKKFKELRDKAPEKLKEPLKLSWSNWGFGMESLEDSCARLSGVGLKYIELHGNHYGPDLGYGAEDTMAVLRRYDMKVSGVCGMFSAHNDLSSNVPHQRQAAVDYLRRTMPFTAAVGGHYLLVVPGAVGRPGAYDANEFDRSVETLRIVADLFVQHSVRAAIEPIRADEVSFVHTVADAKKYIAAVNHPGVSSINGDLYHKGDCVVLHIELLPAGERAAGVPEDTAALPLEMWVKGELLAESAHTGESVRVRTAIGREVEGTLTNCDPGYRHDFGSYVPELAQVHRQVVDILSGKGAC